MRYAQRVGENWFGRAGENAVGGRHQWSYWSDMGFGEALLFKQWDRKARIIKHFCGVKYYAGQKISG